MSRRRNIARERDLSDSAVALRKTLGDDETVPRAISFNEGNDVAIQTNVYNLQLEGNHQVYQYDVVMQPEMLNPKCILHFVYSAICGPNAGMMSQNEKWQKVIFDGQRLIYSSLDNLAGTFHISPRADKASDKEVVVTITQTKSLSPADAESFLQIYNTAFHKAYSTMGLSNFRRKWIDDKNSKRAGSFNIFQGYKPNVSSLSGGLSYIVDLATRIDREGTLYDALKSGNQDPRRRSELESLARSLQLQTTHLPKKQKQINVAKVYWDKKPSDTTFEKKDKKTGTSVTISLAEYYATTYHHNCPDDDVIVAMPHKKAQGGIDMEELYPASVIKATGITDSERRDGQTMRQIASVTKIEPGDRKQRLDKFVESLRQSSSASNFLNQWGITIGQSQSLKGKTIPPPHLAVSEQRSSTPKELSLQPNLSFQKDLRNISLACAPEYHGTVLVVCTRDDESFVRDHFLRDLKDVSVNLNLRLPEPEVHTIDGSHPNAYTNEVVNYIQTKGVPCFVICVLPTAEKARYDGIKNVLTVQLGIPSQCVVMKTIDNPKGGKSVATNVAIQIASKTGGVPYYVSHKDLKLSKTMLVGLSVTASKGYSAPVCAITATYDKLMTQYLSDAISMKGGETGASEEFLTNFLNTALGKFKEANGNYPSRIIVYRDGVSYGQMPKLKKTEVPAIENAIKQTGSQIALIFIVAQKHGSIRIMKSAGGSGIGNASAGTVVTEGVGAAGVAEFYLISHYANQGSANPTRYTIIHESPAGSMNGENLIKLTHYMTLQYPNWSGSIRIPACLMLASRLGEFTKMHLGSEAPNKNLMPYLHFL